MIGAPASFRTPVSVDLPDMTHRRPGRPSKGERERVALRLPVPLRRAVQAAAARDGMTVNDFVGHALADKVGVPYAEQEALPLRETA